MQVQSLLPIAASVALFGVTGVVSLRLLFLAWKTRELPERLMGFGLGCMIFVFFPVMAATGMGRVPVGEVNFPLLLADFPFFAGGFTCIVCFTWRVFRPFDDWAAVLAVGLGIVASGTLGGMLGAVHASPADMGSFEAGQLWSGLLRLPLIAAFAWTGIEGWLSYGKARRRLALGLIGPVITNRFLLWALVGLAQVAIHGVSTVLHFKGMGMMSSPVGLLAVACGASVGSAALMLVFLPPSAYLRWIERRGAAVVAV